MVYCSAIHESDRLVRLVRLGIQAKADLDSPNPTSWLADDAWAQICSLGQMEAFKVTIATRHRLHPQLQELKEDFVTHEENWKLIFDALEPV